MISADGLLGEPLGIDGGERLPIDANKAPPLEPDDRVITPDGFARVVELKGDQVVVRLALTLELREYWKGQITYYPDELTLEYRKSKVWRSRWNPKLRAELGLMPFRTQDVR